MSIYQSRQEKIYDWMAAEEIALTVFEDAEHSRNPSLRWLSGHNGDALLFLCADRRSVLAAWDINMAKILGCVDVIIPYGEFKRDPIEATLGIAKFLGLPPLSKIEIPTSTPYLKFLKYLERLEEYDLICREGGAEEECVKLRAQKDPEEQKIYERGAEITNEVIDLLETEFPNLKTETDTALFIEAEARKRGCEGLGFETLAAGPSRSFGIHAFPAYTAGGFGGKGFSILDFGLNYQGYTTDVTLTFARGPLSETQKTMLSLVEGAYDNALAHVKEGADCRSIAAGVDKFFKKSKKIMPHGLGHGIGLEAHESPFINGKAENRLAPGMIFTLEPGLYDPVEGGCRLENDILLTEGGPKVLTKSRIIRL
jgi:Xaa-Pro dipeptidase